MLVDYELINKIIYTYISTQLPRITYNISKIR